MARAAVRPSPDLLSTGIEGLDDILYDVSP
jgi:hypothetical protein